VLEFELIFCCSFFFSWLEIRVSDINKKGENYILIQKATEEYYTTLKRKK
jgi:hypothetical protein